jgi:murein DD-endopeptidase MepM/ murein hydrolase activator NlpD
VAVTDGLVDFVSTEDVWDPAVDDPATRSGLAVAIIGDDGVRYYGSHLSEVEPGIVVGARVEAGELLGKVGDTGDARGKDAHLHFGISHPTFPEDWHTRRGEVDPFSYLEAWRIGVYITPKLP